MHLMVYTIQSRDKKRESLKTQRNTYRYKINSENMLFSFEKCPLTKIMQAGF